MYKKRIVVIAIFLLFGFLSLLLMNKFSQQTYETEYSTRGENIDNLTVQLDENIYKIKNDSLVKNYDTIIKNVKDISLSVIDNTAFFFNNKGFVSFDLETEETKLLNYDVMNFAVAGLNYIYYKSDDKLYTLASDGTYETVDNNIFEKLFVVGDNLYYASGNNWISINLIDDNKQIKLETQGELREAVFVEGKIIIVTDKDMYKLVINEEDFNETD